MDSSAGCCSYLLKLLSSSSSISSACLPATCFAAALSSQSQIILIGIQIFLLITQLNISLQPSGLAYVPTVLRSNLAYVLGQLLMTEHLLFQYSST